ncbi:MAG: acyl-CoA/acyl-ACP dehydrogenase [Pirellulaceae bacterium]|nr:acyl-CoA/acyl-ACP dehydrogenase [Pirellulaceae bacterium]
MLTTITSSDDAALRELCAQLRLLAGDLEGADAWPAEQLQLCADYGVFEWFITPELGGQGWTEAEILRGYLKLSAACLTTTFVITQRMGACRRIAVSHQEEMKRTLLPDLLRGRKFATVGISHLTTSRRHLTKPVLRAKESADGFVLDGFSPWVTGAPHADLVVIGATLSDGRQILANLDTRLPGVSVPAPVNLVGLSASKTGPVHCQDVEISRDAILAGPVEGVMSQGVGAKTGGLQTSTLAIGLADAAIDLVEAEATNRPEFVAASVALRRTWSSLRDDLLTHADGDEVCSNEELRIRANSLALRAAQTALAAAKGTGFVVGHPAGRWCREALFFLVWSCPQPVIAANLCELAGITD